MAYLEQPSQLYNGTAFRKLRQNLMIERVDSEGNLLCEHCGKVILNSYDCIAHHIEPVTLDNLNDINITMNPKNIALVHARCHNSIHERFGYGGIRKVYYIWGSPCSGKTTFVQEAKGSNDIVVDIDSIWQCVTGEERYIKPRALNQNVFMLRDLMLDMIRMRTGGWRNAWVIEGGARSSDRKNRLQTLGAEEIHIDTDMHTCLDRLSAREMSDALKLQWERYIIDWWEMFDMCGGA